MVSTTTNNHNDTKKKNGFEIYNQARKEESASYQEYMRPVLEKLVEEGLSTYQIALWLISNGYKTIRGKNFTSLLVWQLLEKLGLKTQWAAPDIGKIKPAYVSKSKENQQ